MPTDIKEILKSIKDGIMALAEGMFMDYTAEARQDAQAIYESFKEDIERWTIELASGELTEEDLKFLLKGKKDLMKITALTQAGISKIELDKFRQGVVEVVFSAITKVIK